MNWVYASLLLSVTFSYSVTKPVLQQYRYKKQLPQLEEHQRQNKNILDPVFEEYSNIENYPNNSELNDNFRPHALFYRYNQDDLPKQDEKTKNQRKVLKKIRIYRIEKLVKAENLNPKIVEISKSYAVVDKTPSNGERAKNNIENYNSQFASGQIRTRSIDSDHQHKDSMETLKNNAEDLNDLSKDEVAENRDPNLIKEMNATSKEINDSKVSKDNGEDITAGKTSEVNENLSVEEIVANVREIILSEFRDHMIATAEDPASDGNFVAPGIEKTVLQDNENRENVQVINLHDSIENLTSSIMSTVGEKFRNFVISKVDINKGEAEGDSRVGKAILDLKSEILENLKKGRSLLGDAEKKDIIIMVVGDDFGSTLPEEEINISNVNLPVKEIRDLIHQIGNVSSLDKSGTNVSQENSEYLGDQLKNRGIDKLEKNSSSTDGHSHREDTVQERDSSLFADQIRAIGSSNETEETTSTSGNKNKVSLDDTKRTDGGGKLDIFTHQQEGVTNNMRSVGKTEVLMEGNFTTINQMVVSENMEQTSSSNSFSNTLRPNINVAELAKLAEITFGEGPIQGGIVFEREQQLEVTTVRNSKSLVSSDNEKPTLENEGSLNSTDRTTHIDKVREEEELSLFDELIGGNGRNKASLPSTIERVAGATKDEVTTTSLNNLENDVHYETTPPVTTNKCLTAESNHGEPIPTPIALIHKAELNFEGMQSNLNFNQSNDRSQEDPFSKVDPSALNVNTDRQERKLPSDLLPENTKMEELLSKPVVVNPNTNEDILIPMNLMQASSNLEKEDEIANKEISPVIVHRATHILSAITPLNQAVDTALLEPLPVAIALSQNSPLYTNPASIITGPADIEPEEPLPLPVALTQNAHENLQQNLTITKDFRLINKEQNSIDKMPSISVINQRQERKFPLANIIKENFTVETDETSTTTAPINRSVFEMQDETLVLPRLTEVANLPDKIPSVQAEMDKNVNMTKEISKSILTTENVDSEELLPLLVALTQNNNMDLVAMKYNTMKLEDELDSTTKISLSIDELPKSKSQPTSVVTEIENEEELLTTSSEIMQKVGLNEEKTIYLDFGVDENLDRRQEKDLPIDSSEFDKTEILKGHEKVPKVEGINKHTNIPCTSSVSESENVTEKLNESVAYAIETQGSVSMIKESYLPGTILPSQHEDEVIEARKPKGDRDIIYSEIAMEALPQAAKVVEEASADKNNLVLDDSYQVSLPVAENGSFSGEIGMRNAKAIAGGDVSTYSTAILSENQNKAEFSKVLQNEKLLEEVINQRTDKSHDDSEIAKLNNFGENAMEPNEGIAFKSNRRDDDKDVVHQKVSVSAEKSLLVKSENLEAMDTLDAETKGEHFMHIPDDEMTRNEKSMHIHKEKKAFEDNNRSEDIVEEIPSVSDEILDVTSGVHSDTDIGEHTDLNFRSSKGGIMKTEIINLSDSTKKIPSKIEVTGSDKSEKRMRVQKKVTENDSLKSMNSQSTIDHSVIEKYSTPSIKIKDNYETKVKDSGKNNLRGNVKYFNGANFKLFRDARVLRQFHSQKPTIDIVLNRLTSQSGNHITNYRSKKYYSGQSFRSANSIVNENLNSGHGADMLSSLRESTSPVNRGRAIEHGENSRPAKYYYRYKVNDQTTGDIKSQEEERNGAFTRGTYSFHEADGTIRTVDYQVNGPSGFQAVVRRTGQAVLD